jgi:phosphohistidine swiveling domain-containing protein
MMALAPIALTDPAARDPSVGGVKAAGLAAAAEAGLPVLAGRILPLEASEAAIAAGAEALERSGAPAAYLAVMESPVPPDLDRALLPPVGGGEDRYVVRSTTGRDDDGRWSGAFASYLGIEAGDLPTAVRGCWASAFSSDVLGRCSEAGVDVRTLRVGVLVQPSLGLDRGGTARVRGDGTVVVAMARGGSAGVVGGRRGGVDLTVGPDAGTAEDLGDDEALATAVAALARRAAETVAADVIEWGSVGDEVFLLQVGPAAPEETARPEVIRPWGPATSTVGSIPVGSIPDGAERLARLVTAFAGPLADELVIPWALGATEVPVTAAIPVDDPRSALRAARAVSGDAAAGVWLAARAAARDRAAAASRLLLEGKVEEGLGRIHGLRAPDPAAARRVVGLVRGLGEELARAGVLPSPLLVWRLTGPEIERAILGTRPVLRSGPGRWEPFVADVVRARGRGWRVTPASPGIGAGRPHVLRDLRAIGRSGPREVLVVPLPLPHLAPLLWHSAALVTTGGTSGAHLFEVARSLGVPAVIGGDPEAFGEAGSVVAVDGDAGVVSIVPALERAMV